MRRDDVVVARDAIAADDTAIDKHTWYSRVCCGRPLLRLLDEGIAAWAAETPVGSFPRAVVTARRFQ